MASVLQGEGFTLFYVLLAFALDDVEMSNEKQVVAQGVSLVLMTAM